MLQHRYRVGLITEFNTETKMKERLIEFVDQIEAQVETCCAVTMDPEETLELIDRLRELIKEMPDE